MFAPKLEPLCPILKMNPMINLPAKILVVGLAACLAGTLSAQTTYIGSGSGSALDIATSGNWSNGLPTSLGNIGTINTNSTVNAAGGSNTYSNYYLTLTGGVMSQFNTGNDPIFSGGTFTVNGGTYGTSGGRGFRVNSSNVTTLTTGKIISGSSGSTQINSGSSLTVNGGSLETYGGSRGISLSGGSTLTINAGSVFTDVTGSATNTFGIGSLATGNNIINLNGGTTNVNFLGFGRNNSSSQLTLNLGGTTTGSFTAVNFVTPSVNELVTERAINWLSGSKMTMTITNADEWAATEWTANRLFFDGQSSTALGNLSWADASNSAIGLGSGYYWNFNSSSETLTLAAIPERNSTTLFGLALGAVVLIRRRPARNP